MQYHSALIISVTLGLTRQLHILLKGCELLQLVVYRRAKSEIPTL
jgi:hypothetical protein